MKFTKYHALGNDYLILQESLSTHAEMAMPQPELIRWICNRHHGVGADGILIAVGSLHDRLSTKQEQNVTTKGAKGHEGEDFALDQAPLAVRIFNPDGSEAEKSGNGLRIFARGLFDVGLVGDDPFEVDTLGGRVHCQVLDDGRRVRVGMGVVRFLPRLVFDVNEMVGWAADIGNPHCVIFREAISMEETLRFGPMVENDPRFPHRTNVQFAKVLDRHNLQLEIWERGAGYTLASGSSSCAAAAVAVRLGLCDGDVQVHMPGGLLYVSVAPNFAVQQVGPVARIGTMEWSPDRDEGIEQSV